MSGTIPYTRKKLIADIMLGLGVLGFLLTGISFLNGWTDTSYPFTFSRSIEDVNDRTRIFNFGVKMESTTYSAQTPIDVDVRIHVTRGEEPSEILVAFPNSYIYPLSESPEVGVYHSGSVRATKSTDGAFTGTGRILYPLGGCYPVFLTGAIDLSIPNRIDIPSQVALPCDVQISGLEATTQHKANNINTALSYLIVALTLLSLRPLWHAFIRRAFESEDGKETPNPDSQDGKPS